MEADRHSYVIFDSNYSNGDNFFKKEEESPSKTQSLQSSSFDILTSMIVKVRRYQKMSAIFGVLVLILVVALIAACTTKFGGKKENDQTVMKPEDSQNSFVSSTQNSFVSSTTTTATTTNNNNVTQDPDFAFKIGAQDDCGIIKRSYPSALDGIYALAIPGYGNKGVFCDMSTDGGGWTVILRRNGSSFNTDFDSYWHHYVDGFGYRHLDYWFGLGPIKALTDSATYKLRIDMGHNSSYIVYNSFKLGNASTNYKLQLGTRLEGNLIDDFQYHNQRPFSTKDSDHDLANYNCAQETGGGWWYGRCYKVLFTGMNATTKVVWKSMTGKKSNYEFVEMKIKQ